MSMNAIFEEEKVQKTLELLLEQPDLKVAEACRRTRASYGRVQRRLKGHPPSNSRGGHNKKLLAPEEEALKNHLLFLHHLGRNGGKDHVKLCANRLLEYRGVTDKNGDIASVSRLWINRFMTRHKEFIKTLKSRPLSWLRRRAHNKEDIQNHFNDFKRCRDKWSIQDEDIYNFDETGCQIGISGGSHVVVPQGEEKIFLNDPDNKELVTCVECFNATGYHVPPMLIFKGAYHLKKYFDNDIDGNTLFARSETGFTNDILTMAWIRHFEKFTQPRAVGAYRMLIFDGYGSHITQDFIDFCWEHRIRPFLLPAHSTHLTQPADVGAFQKYKFEFKAELRKHIFLGGNAVSKTDFFALFQTFSDRTWTSKLCTSAFRKTGLIPFNPSIVLEKMADYGGIQEAPLIERGPSSSPGFATPPPNWHQFDTPKTYTGRKRGADYVEERLWNGMPLTPSVKRVKSKVDKFTEAKLHNEQLATAHLTTVLAYQKVNEERNNQAGTIVQKYGEIYGHEARREIEWAERDTQMVGQTMANRRIRLENERVEKARKKEEREKKKRDKLNS